ncbi:MAG: PilZ domain-containing protein [Spirochaetaceae bacterium]|nr:PilZ domain-containing protein [Spirochaetaceae bacterium]
MATSINWIEKEYYLKVLIDEGVSILLHKNKKEHILALVNQTKTELSFKLAQPIKGLKQSEHMNLVFEYKGVLISIPVNIISVKEDIITTNLPQSLYKNLGRAFIRISVPDDMEVTLQYIGELYKLNFPKLSETEWEKTKKVSPKEYKPEEINTLLQNSMNELKKISSGLQTVLFNQKAPETTEEQLIAATGRCLFLSSTKEPFPESDISNRVTIVTNPQFKRFLEISGVGALYIDESISKFIKGKQEGKVYSDCWMPVMLYEYVIGYIHIWTGDEPRFNEKTLDLVSEYASLLIASLIQKGSFAPGKLRNDPFQPEIQDISASGLSFSIPRSQLSQAIRENDNVAVKIKTADKVLDLTLRVMRRIKGSNSVRYGCRYLEMSPDDTRFLFENLYGKSFGSDGTKYLQGAT